MMAWRTNLRKTVLCIGHIIEEDTGATGIDQNEEVLGLACFE